MKGYSIETGFMGYVEGCYMLFASEAEYFDYIDGEEESEVIS